MNDRQRLFAGVLVVVGLVTFTRCNGDNATPAPVPTPTVTVTVTATPPPAPDDGEEEPTPAPTSTDYRGIAERAVNAWKSRDVAVRQAELAAVAAPEYVRLIASTDPANTPDAAISTVDSAVQVEGVWIVPVTLTDSTRLNVIIEDRDRPVVTDIRPA